MTDRRTWIPSFRTSLMSSLKQLDEVTYRIDFQLEAGEIYAGVQESVKKMALHYPMQGFRSPQLKYHAVEKLSLIHI